MNTSELTNEQINILIQEAQRLKDLKAVNLETTKRWQRNNTDNLKYKANNLKKANKNYNSNKEDISEKRKVLYSSKKEIQAMMNILI